METLGRWSDYKNVVFKNSWWLVLSPLIGAAFATKPDKLTQKVEYRNRHNGSYQGSGTEANIGGIFGLFFAAFLLIVAVALIPLIILFEFIFKGFKRASTLNKRTAIIFRISSLLFVIIYISALDFNWIHDLTHLAEIIAKGMFMALLIPLFYIISLNASKRASSIIDIIFIPMFIFPSPILI